MPSPAANSRLLLLTDRPLDARQVAALRASSGLPEDAVLLDVSPASADDLTASLPGLLDQLPHLEIAVLGGALSSETWRRQSAFQLHLTLIDAPDSGDLDGAVRGAVAMLS